MRAQELLKNDGSVCIKGNEMDEAVLTTRDQSYAVRLADSSNTMLLVCGPVELSTPEAAAAPSAETAAERTVVGARTVARTEAAGGGEAAASGVADGPPPIQIQARVHEHFELVRCAPRLGRTRALLAACPYAGAAADAALDEPSTAEFAEALAPNRPELRPTLAKLERDAQYAL